MRMLVIQPSVKKELQQNTRTATLQSTGMKLLSFAVVLVVLHGTAIDVSSAVDISSVSG